MPSASRGGLAGRGTPPDPAARRAAQWSAELCSSPGLAIPKRVPGAARTKRLDPADRVPPLAGAVEGEGNELGPAADILPRHGAAEAAVPGRDPAIGGIVAIVAPQPDGTFRTRDRVETVLG